MEHATQTFAAISFLVIGLSHLIRPGEWGEYFRSLVDRGTPGAFLDGFLCLNFGALIASFHNVWQGPAMILTLIGWAQVVKGLVRFVAPQLAIGMLRRMSPERSGLFRAGGVMALALSGFCWWLRFQP